MTFDYHRYGAFKNSIGDKSSKLTKLARSLGIRNRYLKFLRGTSKECRILEVGCGDGSFIRDLKADGFSRIIGVEPSTTYAFQFEADVIRRCDAATFLSGCESDSLDLIIAFDVFEHVRASELRGLIKHMHRVLCPGGELLFRVPNMASPLALTNFFGDMSHTTPLNEISIRQLFFDSGFVICELSPEPLAYPRTPVMLLGVICWPIYRTLHRATLSAFNIRPRILSPNIICRVRKPSSEE